MVMFEFAERFYPVLFSGFRLGVGCIAFAADLQETGGDGGCQYPDNKHDRECRPGKVRCRQLADEILRRLDRDRRSSRDPGRPPT